MESLPSYLSGIVLVLLVSSFVKIVTTLNILRYGIGLKGGGFGLVIVGVSLALSLLVMAPHVEEAGGLQPFLFQQTPDKVEVHFRPFLEKNTQAEIRDRFLRLSQKLGSVETKPPPQEHVALSVLIPAFLISQLKEAFQLGFLILIPFLVVDLVVVNVLMLLNITQLSQAVVSLPLKILLFFAVDGWTLISEKLISSYL